MAVAVNETTNKAYVVNHNSNSVTVIDGKTGTVIATIQTGTGPESIAVNPLTNRVYVANSGENSITVIDGANGTVGNAWSMYLAVKSTLQCEENLVYSSLCMSRLVFENRCSSSFSARSV